MTDNTEIAEVRPAGLSEQDMKTRRTLTLAIYVLQGLSFVVGITSLVAIIMNYVKRNDMRGTWLESHFRWQIRTFWFGLLWTCIAMLLIWTGIAAIAFFVNAAWVIYRIVRGILNLIDNKPMYQ